MSTEGGFIGINIFVGGAYNDCRIYMDITESVTHSGCVGLPIVGCSKEQTTLHDRDPNRREAIVAAGFKTKDVSPEKCERLLTEWLRQSRARLINALQVVELNMADNGAIKAEAAALCAEIKYIIGEK